MQLEGLAKAKGVWGGVPAEIEFCAFYPYNMTFDGSNFTNFSESCVSLTSLYGDKASISRFIFFLNRPFPFFTCINARPPYGREAQGEGFARLLKRPHWPGVSLSIQSM